MTFFSAHGGSTNEGRMTINGMTVAAAFNGGGVSSLTYDTNNVEEVSTLVSGGLGESEIGGPTMNIVPRIGRQQVLGAGVLQHRRRSGRTATTSTTSCARAGITKRRASSTRTTRSASLGGPIKKRPRVVLRQLPQYSTTTPAGSNVRLNLNAGDPRSWDYLRDEQQRRAATDSGPQHLVGARHGAGDRRRTASPSRRSSSTAAKARR